MSEVPLFRTPFRFRIECPGFRVSGLGFVAQVHEVPPPASLRPCCLIKLILIIPTKEFFSKNNIYHIKLVDDIVRKKVVRDDFSPDVRITLLVCVSILKTHSPYVA